MPSPVLAAGQPAPAWQQRLASLQDGWYLAALALAALVFYFAPEPRVALLALLGFAALGGRRPRLALLFVVFSLPFYLRPRQLGDLSFSPTEALLLASAVGWAGGWVWAHWRRRDLSPGPSPVRGGEASPPSLWGKGAGGLGLPAFAWPALLFLLASLLSLAAAEHLHEGLRALRTVVVEPLLLYALLLGAGGGRRQARRLVGALILAAVVVSVIGFYQYLFTGDIITAEEVRRIKVFYGSPNHLGLFLGRVAPLAAALAIFYPSGRRQHAAAAAIVLAAVGLTFSVGAWAGVAAALLLVAWLAGRRMRWGMLGLGLGLAVASPVLLRMERITSHFSFEGGTNALRLQLWQSAVNMVRDHPFLGVGLDNFLYKYPDYALGEVAWREPALSHPHNLVLDFWLSTGLLGLVAMLWLLGLFFAVSWRLYRSRGGPLDRALLVGAMASMVDLVVHGLIDNSYFLVDLAAIFWLNLALVALVESSKAVSELEEERRDDSGVRGSGLHRLAPL